jgi:hypothetical protein
VDVCLVIKNRLEELGFEQKDLAAAAEVTESYISVAGRNCPPPPTEPISTTRWEGFCFER